MSALSRELVDMERRAAEMALAAAAVPALPPRRT